VIRVGTRSSPLALAQAGWVASRLEHAELVEITTDGDRGEREQDKSRWTSALERALLDGRIDIAVHSAKDVPTELTPGTAIVAVPRREDPRDAICGAPSLEALPAGARVGTSSLRRAAQVRALRGDVEIVELRGNVDTRLRKLAAGEADAIILAAAGLWRLNLADAIGGILVELVPAPGQGALIVQGRRDDELVRRLQVSVGNSAAGVLGAERGLARALRASCDTPIGALADALDADGHPVPGGDVRLRGWIGLPDGSQWIADQLIGDPEEVGLEMAERMLAAGAGELLERAQEMAGA
jgi:hydroxymethylbilane synthase